MRPNGVVWRRSGSSTWIRQGVATSVDHDDGGGNRFDAVYRDGVLVTWKPTNWYPFPRVYLEASPGQFEHVANLPSYDGTATTLSTSPAAPWWPPRATPVLTRS